MIPTSRSATVRPLATLRTAGNQVVKNASVARRFSSNARIVPAATIRQREVQNVHGIRRPVREFATGEI